MAEGTPVWQCGPAFGPWANESMPVAVADVTYSIDHRPGFRAEEENYGGGRVQNQIIQYMRSRTPSQSQTGII